MTRILLALACGLALNIAEAQSTLYTNARIVTLAGAPIDKGNLLVTDGKIAAVGADVSAPANAAVVDLAGAEIYPAFITANTVLGLVEVEAVRATVDTAEIGTVNPNARAQVAVNPDSDLLPVARANGVLYAHVVPQVSQPGLIAGSSALMQLKGWTWEDMTVQSGMGMHVYWPSTRLPPWLPANMLEEARKQAAKAKQELVKAFNDARAYRTARQAGEISAPDSRWEAMLPVLEGSMRVFLHASDLNQIREALDFAAREKLDVVLVGGQDAWRMAAELKRRNIPVILHSPYDLPLRRSEGFDTTYRNAARLHAAGVRFAIASDASGFQAPLERNLPYSAAQAVSFGLPWEEGLRAITQRPAEILGIADRLGTLEVGKDASFIVTNGDPLEVRTRVLSAYIAGNAIDLSNKHTRLRDKFEQKYR